MRLPIILPIALAAIVSLAPPAPAPATEGDAPPAAEANWPAWRGPRGDGTSLDPHVPVKFDAEKDAAWKTPIPGKGHASPIIWGDRLFLVTALEDPEGVRALLCLDRKSGEILWQREVLAAPLEKIHRLNSYASSTPATDGERVYVSFLDKDKMFIAAYDFAGEKLWEARPGVFSSVHGYCSSPILWGEKLIVNGDHDGDAYLVALDRKSGETLWKIDRPNKTRSYCTPIIREIGGRTQMLLSGSKCVASYDPDTGAQHWIVDGPTEQYVASLVYNGEYVFLTCGFPERHFMAIDPTGTGNVTESHVAWHVQKHCSYVPSPVAIGPYFLVVDDSGYASCFEAKTGERHWMEKIGRGHSASMLTANGLAYFLADSGTLTVVKPGADFQVAAVSELGEEAYASPAVSRGQLFIRGDRHLFCFGQER
ncbi:MAG: PQQ-binding-like beta-propeller repeat protein [Verrucomicrobiales bacterium]